jgi:hypothetical protein
MSENKVEEEKFDREGFERLQRQAQEYESKLRERLGKFNIKDVLRQAKDLRSIFVEGLGEVRYMLLTQADISEIAKKYPEDAHERSLQALFRSMIVADSEKLMRLIKIVGVLLQMKVYLFWSWSSGYEFIVVKLGLCLPTYFRIKPHFKANCQKHKSCLEPWDSLIQLFKQGC